MKLSRFLLGVATGLTASYMLTKVMPGQPIKPERVIQMVKNRYKNKIEIVGSWIHVEPQIDQVNGIEQNIYVGGFTGLVNGDPTFFEFKVDADTGSLLSIES